MNTELTVNIHQIENRIFTFRGVYVMLDRDLADMYGVETKVLNQAVKRNIDRFPDEFRFQLNKNEKQELVTNCDRFLSLKNSSSNPFAFTEQGVAMLSAVLRSSTAIKISILIINAFVEMRKIVAINGGLLQRMEGIERKQLENENKFEQIFKALEVDTIPTQGVFFEGQVFDAYQLASRIIRSAKNNIVLIDNYINENTLHHLTKKNKGVAVLLLCQSNNAQLLLDVQKANEQYGNFSLKTLNQSHDRFLIIDQTEVYHLGASLKDLGKKWFAFSKLNAISVQALMTQITELI